MRNLRKGRSNKASNATQAGVCEEGEETVASVVVEGTVGGLLKHQRFDGSFPASDAMCVAVTGKGLQEIMPHLRNLTALQGLSDDQIMSLLVAAYFEKHFGGELDVWESAVTLVGDVVAAYTEKVKVVLDTGLVA